MKYLLPAILGITCMLAVAFTGCTVTTGGTASATSPAPGPVGGIPPAPTASLSAVTEISASDNGRIVPVNAGSLLTLRLAENPTTGYQWILITGKGLNITRDVYVPAEATGTVTGSGGTRTWDIVALRPGIETIHATYLRPFEGITGNETVFTVTVDIR